MSDLTVPAESGAAPLSTAAGHAWRKATEPWIVPDVDIADEYTALDETQLNGFQVATTNGLDVTIAAGEAYIAGWLCRDRTTTITLPDNATTTIYLGYDSDAVLPDNTAPADSENIIIGPDGDFTGNDPRVAIYTFTTDAGAVDSTQTDDHRKTEQPITFDPVADRVNVTAELAQQGDPLATSGDLDAHASATDAHHTRYSDTEAIAAVEGEALLSLSGDLETPGYVHADSRVSSGFFRLTGSRFHYDTDLSGEAVHFQRDSATAETALTFAGTWVGIHQATTPEAPVHLGGNTQVDGDADVNGLVDNSGGDGVRPPDVAGNLPSDTVTGRILYDSTREQ